MYTAKVKRENQVTCIMVLINWGTSLGKHCIAEVDE